jgi:ClpP class serine protease
MKNEKPMTASRKFTFPEALWAGTEHSLSVAAEAHDVMMAGMFDQPASPVAAAADVPYNFSMDGDVGVISIHGPLVNSDSPYNQYRGVTSYADIRRAMVYAATQEAVQAIVLDINSGGGSVSGCAASTRA